MACVFYGFNLPLNKDDKQKKVANAIVAESTSNNNTRVQLLLASAVSEKTAKEIIDEVNKANKNNSGWKEIPQVENLYDLNGNTLKKLLRNYAIIVSKDISMYRISHTGKELRGFTTEVALEFAKEYTANELLRLYYSKQNEANLTPKKLYDAFRENVSNTWKNLVLPKFIENARNFINENKDETKLKAAINDIIKTKAAIDNINQEIFDDEETKIKRTEVLNCLLISQVYNFINSFDKIAKDKTFAGIIQMKNYTALYMQVESDPFDYESSANSWFRQVLNLSKINEISRWLEKPLQKDSYEQDTYEDEDDYANPEHDTEERDNGWDKGKVQLSYDKLLTKDFKILLNSQIYKLNSAASKEIDKWTIDVKDDNPLGVPELMDGKVVYGKLLSMCTNLEYLRSLETLAERIRNISQSNKEMYGLYILADLIENNRAIGNMILNQLKLARINKVLIVFDEENIDIVQNNRGILPHAELFADFTDSIQRNFLNVNESALTYLREVRKIIDTKFDMYRLIDDIDKKNEKLNYVKEVIYRYTSYIMPIISKEVIDIAVDSAFNSGNNEKLKQFVDTLMNLGQEAVEEAKRYHKELAKYNLELYNFYKEINYTEEENNDAEKPEFDYNSFMTLKGNKNLVTQLHNLVDILGDYILPAPELNSVNAESNQSSNLIGNNYLTTIIDLLKSGKHNEGAEAIKEFYQTCPQLKYNPLFVGIPGTSFKGMFKENKDGSISINKEGIDQMSITLFDGVRSSDFDKSGTYTTLTKADYLFSQAILYFNSLSNPYTGEVKKTTSFMLDTPSDGQKNFLMTIDKINDSNIYNIENAEELTKDITNKLSENIHETKSEELDRRTNEILSYLEKYKNNTINDIQLYNILTNPNYIFSTRSYKEKSSTDKTGTYQIYYKVNDNILIMTISGEYINNKNAIKNIKVTKLQYAIQYSDKELQIRNKVSIPIIKSISKLALENAIKENKANYTINKQSDVFIGYSQLLLGELYNFAKQLNNVVEQNSYNEKDYSFKIKVSTSGLIDKVHYNGGKILSTKNGKTYFAGNFFKFTTLFKIGNYDVNKEIYDTLSLYGGAKSKFIIKDTEGNNILNLKNYKDIFIIDSNHNIVLNENSEIVKKLINDITEKWLNNFIHYTINNLSEYNLLIEQNFKRDKNKGITDFINFNLTTSLARISAQSILTGSDKFYKDSRTYLKRAKEIQANGSSHNQGDNFSKFGEEIKTNLINGKEEIIREVIINGTKQYLTARNGFRAVTIHNSNKNSATVEDLRRAVTKSIYEKVDNGELSKDVANNIIDNIIKGFDVTTTINDAQSYITFEEFIRRVYADGTYMQYKELIDDIYAVREGKKSIAELDINKINSRIQVRKNVYFDQQLDTHLGVAYPRFIKNAEFVIIPELIGEDSSLKELYDIMQEFGIDQINTEETSKASNRDVLTFWDNNGIAHGESFRKELSTTIGEGKDSYSPSIENYYYRFLYKQQEVAQHAMDEVNKAGLQVMKKILDNIANLDQNDPLVQASKRLIENYTSNVKQSFEGFLTRMGWKVNSNGQIVNISDNSPMLNFREFYKYAEAEARRLGMDSNFQDYFKTDINGNPLMPSYLNISASKLENVFQSLFNSNITRQKLPGWHMTQVTRVGFEGAYDSTGKKVPLKYHEVGEDNNDNPVVEILIPRWNSSIPKYEYKKLSDDKAEDIRLNDIARKEHDAKILKALHEAGLDEQIIYRIPTEGKQSMAIARIVGFVDDIYGSTIIVPDEWVTQTGSDFDVDSIYGICHNFYYDNASGKFIKNKEVDETNELSLKNGYINKMKEILDESEEIYIQENAHEEFSSIKESKTTLKQIRKDLTKLRKELKYNDNYKELKDKLIEISSELPDELYRLWRKEQKGAKENTEIDGKFKQSLYDLHILSSIEQLYFKYSEDKIISKMYDIAKDIVKINDIVEEKKELYTTSTELAKNIINEECNLYDRIAKKYGLLTYENYLKLSNIDKQSREARNNAIVDSFINIMRNNRSLEENLSRSNFDDITNVKNYLEALNNSLSKSNLPIGDTLSQVIFMNDAIMGARLKARSVMRDTFLSIANRTHAKVTSGLAIKVEYDLEFKDGETTIYNEDYIKDHYDARQGENGLIVTHDKLGWNDNNRNIIGRLITVYGSETTAHILDAVKIGAIYNETEDTFGVFKTMLDLGIDYYTAMAFLAQPQITDLVNEFDKGNSLYFDEKPNAFKQSLLNLATNIGITDLNIYNGINTIFNKIAESLNLTNEKGELLTYNEYKNGIVLNHRKLFETIKKGKDDDFKHRLDILIFFDKLNDVNKEIEGVINLLNPDKLSAKQTIFETRRMLCNVLEKGFGNRPSRIITENGKNIIESIYTGLLSENGINENESGYGTIACMLKYSTIPSIIINTQIFDFEGSGFVTDFYKLWEIYKTIDEINSNVELDEKEKKALINSRTAQLYGVVDNIEAALQTKFTTETYKQFKQYAVSECSYNIPELVSQVDIDENGLYIPSTGEEIIENANGINDNRATLPVNYWNKEISRIFGYDAPNRIAFDVEHFNAPSKEEIESFKKLTPVQKVVWLQDKSGQDIGIFGRIKVRRLYDIPEKMSDNYRKMIYDEKYDIETTYNLFRTAAFSNNPLVRLAVLDLVKYAFIVEGGQFKKGSIGKIITNDFLLASHENGGIAFNIGESFIGNFNREVYRMKESALQCDKEFVTKFIRSHENMVYHYKATNYNNGRFKYTRAEFIQKHTHSDGAIFIPYGEENSQEAITIADLYTDNINNTRSFVIIIRQNKKVKFKQLYKIRELNKGILLTPVGILEENEHTEYSVNNSNNPTYSDRYYDEVYKNLSNGDYILNNDGSITYTSSVNNITQYKVENFASTKYKAKNAVPLRFIESFDNPAVNGQLNNYFNDLNREIYPGYIAITDYRINKELENVEFSIQEITLNDDRKQIYAIYPLGKVNSNRTYKLLIEARREGKVEESTENKLGTGEIKLIKYLSGFPNYNQHIYKVVPITEEKVIQINKAYMSESANDKEREYISTGRIGGEFMNTAHDKAKEINDVDRLTGRLAKSLSQKRDIHDNDISRNFSIKVNMGEILINDPESLRRMSKSIYDTAARYYKSEALRILNEFKQFAVNGAFYNISEDALYEELLKEPKRYDDLLELLLYAKNFGNEISEFFKLDVSIEDREIQESFNEIIKAINSVRNNTLLVGKNGAIVKLFDIYISKKYSTNPLVRMALIKLRTQFGDINWFDSKIADIGELNNKQVQTTIQIVYTILNKAKEIDAPDAQLKFFEQFDKIMEKGGAFDWNKVIKDGKYITQYKDDFLIDKEKVKEEYIKARDEYGIYDIRTLKAKLNRDKFFAKYVEQPIVESYYNEINECTEELIEKAPHLYPIYLELRNRLLDLKYDKTGISVDALKEIREIRHKLFILRNPYITLDDAEENDPIYGKSELYKDEKAVLDKVIERLKKINEEYKDVDPLDSWNIALQKYLNIIEDYDNDNPAMSISKKLENPQYYEAYNWIQHNTMYSIDEKTNEKIREAFDIVTGQKEGEHYENPAKKWFRQHDAYDEFGKLNGLKLTLEQQRLLKDLESKQGEENDKQNFKSGQYLIKSLGNIKTVYVKKEFWDAINPYISGGIDTKYNVEREAIAKSINRIYENVDSRAKDESVKHHKVERVLTEDGINVLILFKYAKQSELETLADLYKDYRNFDSGRSEEQKQAIAEFIKANAHTEYNFEQFNKDKSDIYGQYGSNSPQATLFNAIFGRHLKGSNLEVREKGVLQPSDEVYGKLVPNDEKYIDKKITGARKFLDQTIEYVPNAYYYEAQKKAVENGNYQEWYNANHYYNVYLRKFVPTSVWTEMRLKDTSGARSAYRYVPTFDNVNRKVKDKYDNTYHKTTDENGNVIYKGKHKSYGVNYKSGSEKYDNNSYPVEGTKEYEMLELLQETASKYALNNHYKKFAELYAPRLRETKTTKEFWRDGILSAIGFNYKNTNSDDWHENISYSNDSYIQFDMFDLLKNENTKKEIPIRRKNPEESDKDYHAYVEATKKENEKIREKNYEIDKALRNENWRDVFGQMVIEGEMMLAREHTKNTLYLLMEDIATNPAYKVNWKRRKKNELETGKPGESINIDRRNSNGEELLTWQTEMQERVLEVLDNFAHRVIYDEYKKPSALNKFSNFIQSYTSAKYMSLNIHGGFANVNTGYINILAEVIAGQYVSKRGMLKAEKQYAQNIPAFLADMYQNDASNLISAIFKLMEFVDYDEINNRLEQCKTAAEVSKMINDFLYSFNSMGEHHMQGVVGLGMINDSKVYIDSTGKYTIGNINDYTRDAEYDALAEIITEYSEKYGDGNFDILKAFKNYVKRIKEDMDYANEFDDFSKDFCIEFLNIISPKINKNYSIKDEFIKRREAIIEKAEKEFEEEQSLLDQFEFVPTKNGRGIARLKVDSLLNYNTVTNELSDRYGNDELARFMNKIRSVNNKIHGVYNKLGRAYIEKYWYGNLVMQYHKHIYPGLMKRYRGLGRALGLGMGSKGYYNESRQSIEYGSYVSLVKLLFTDLNVSMREAIAGKKYIIDDNGEIAITDLTVAQSIQNVAHGLIAGLIHIKQNYRNMSKWEQANVRRAIADFAGMLGTVALLLLLYGMWDDDELKNDLLKANDLYTASRFFSEAIMWTPSGLYSEGVALWDSPIAGGGSITDIFKALDELSSLLFGDKEDLIYKSGPNSGRYKLEVLVTRNTPVYRIYKNIMNMGKRNTYYNGGTSNLSAQKYIKDWIRDHQQ